MNRNGTIGRGLSALRAGAAPTLFALSCFAAAAQAEDALKIGDVKAVLSVASERSRMPTPMPKRIDLVSSERASVSEGPHVLDSGSKREAAQVYLPKQYGEKDAWPVILLLHGYGGLHGNDGFLVRLFSGSENLIDYYFGMSARVSKSGFILVVPNGNKDSNGRRY